MNTITLNDGTVFETRWCAAAGGVLSCLVLGDESMLSLAEAFSRPAAVQTIVFSGDGNPVTYAGYIAFISLMDQRYYGDGIMVQMRREGENNG